jgi:PIF1-like helicase
MWMILMRKCCSTYLVTSVTTFSLSSLTVSSQCIPYTESYYIADIIKEDYHIVLDDNTGLDFLSLINHNGVPLHHLRLKIGAVCTLMRNMSVKKRLVKNA